MKKFSLLLLTLAFVLSFGMVYAQQAEAPKDAPPAAAPAPAEQPKAPEAPAATPAPKPAPDPKFVQSEIEDIDKQMKDKRYLQVGRKIKSLLRNEGLDEAAKKKCEDYMTELNKIGMDKLKEAEGLVQNDLPGAVMIYNELRNWPSDEVKNQAVQAYGKLNSTPELQEAYKKAQVEANARGEVKSIEAQLEKKNYTGVLFSYVNLINRYPDTKTAKDSQAKLDELKKNKEFTDAINKAKEKEIGRTLQNIGFSYARYNEKEEAVKFHKMVMEKFPESDIAKRADAEIKKLTEVKEPAADDAKKPAANPEEVKKALEREIGQNLVNMGQAYSRYGEKDEAIKYLKLAIEKFPETDIAKRADAQIKILNGEAPAKAPRNRHAEEEE